MRPPPPVSVRITRPLSDGSALGPLVADDYRTFTPDARTFRCARFNVEKPVWHHPENGIGPPPSGEPVRLDDGWLVLVRPVRPSDVPLMVDGFARLSLHSRRMRFLTGKNGLTPRELRFFTDVDHRDHEALGALDAVTGRGVGVARYIRDRADLHSAEVAITVVDEWQRRGLGWQLFVRLAQRAQTEGIRRFNGLIAADNQAVVALLRRMDADIQTASYDADTAKFEISLLPPLTTAHYPPIWRMSCH